MEMISGGAARDGRKGPRPSTKLSARVRDAFFKEVERFLKENPEHLQHAMKSDPDFLLGFMQMCMRQTPRPPLEIFQEISGGVKSSNTIEIVFHNRIDALLGVPKTVEIPPIQVIRSKDSPGNLFEPGGPDPVALGKGFPPDVRRIKDVELVNADSMESEKP